jgi:hypothetical protein
MRNKRFATPSDFWVNLWSGSILGVGQSDASSREGEKFFPDALGSVPSQGSAVKCDSGEVGDLMTLLEGQRKFDDNLVDFRIARGQLCLATRSIHGYRIWLWRLLCVSCPRFPAPLRRLIAWRQMRDAYESNWRRRVAEKNILEVNGRSRTATGASTGAVGRPPGQDGTDGWQRFVAGCCTVGVCACAWFQ